MIDDTRGTDATFVAVNEIRCEPDYCERFECLFCTRAKAIDRMPGFLEMMLLKPNEEGKPYLVVSKWVDEASFRAWVGSPEFHEGHKRAFEDLAEAKREGRNPPMTSDFGTYSVLTR
ncbi:MAG: antibiotic biosynthesis monooxygenase [Fimbriimonadaceae bacterium]